MNVPTLETTMLNLCRQLPLQLSKPKPTFGLKQKIPFRKMLDTRDECSDIPATCDGLLIKISYYILVINRFMKEQQANKTK